MTHGDILQFYVLPYGSIVIHFRVLMFWNKSELKKRGLVLIFCLFLHDTSSEIKRGAKVFRNDVKNSFHIFYQNQINKNSSLLIKKFHG